MSESDAAFIRNKSNIAFHRNGSDIAFNSGENTLLFAKEHSKAAIAVPTLPSVAPLLQWLYAEKNIKL